MGNALCLLESLSISSFSFFLDKNHFFFRLKLELSYSLYHFCKLGKSLFAFMDLKRVMKLYFLVYGLNGLIIIITKLDFLPKLVRSVLSFSSFYAEIKLTFVFNNSCILGVA